MEPADDSTATLKFRSRASDVMREIAPAMG